MLLHKQRYGTSRGDQEKEIEPSLEHTKLNVTAHSLAQERPASGKENWQKTTFRKGACDYQAAMWTAKRKIMQRVTQGWQGLALRSSRPTRGIQTHPEFTVRERGNKTELQLRTTMNNAGRKHMKQER